MQKSRGFSLIEVIISAALVAVAGMTAVAYVTRAAGHTDWAGDKVYARQKALSLIAEMRAFVEGGEGEVAADLDGFDDGLSFNASLSIAPDVNDPGAFVPPAHPLSGNVREVGNWRWNRQISVRPFAGSMSRDLRVCTARMFRHHIGSPYPGERMAEVSTVIRTVGEAYPSTQVFDVYLLALENVPGWWVHMGAMQPFVEGTVRDLEVRNPGLKFRAHWITTLGYGRDEEYAPYTNKERDSRATTPWAYVYPGRMPDGEATPRYYVPEKMGARINLDGLAGATFVNDTVPQEPFTDTNGNARRDPGEPFVDVNGDKRWNVGNEAPYAFADMHNHCMRYPDAEARYQERIDAQLSDAVTPSWRLLLDRMVADPDSFHNTILVNLHGELLPMPPTRNFSDAAKDPETREGWRVVAHPERLRPKRVQGDDAASDAPVYRLYAYKAAFPAGHEPLMSQREPFEDVDGNGAWDAGEDYKDWNGNGVWDAGLPISLVVNDGDFSANPNGAANPSILVQRLAGGIDADDDGNPDAYDANFQTALSYPETFQDLNGDKIRQVQEPYLDRNANGLWDVDEPYTELDGDGTFSAVTETLDDANGNGIFDSERPAEPYTDTDTDGSWDAGEPYLDFDMNGTWSPPTNPTPPAWRAFTPADDATNGTRNNYAKDFGEPFQDMDGDDTYDAPEPFFDTNSNNVCDGGFARGEMWYQIGFDAPRNRTVLLLHGTPLETPSVAGLGLPSHWRLYDLDYVPCPTPVDATAGGDRFARNLASNGDFPKNTARWRITLPLAQCREAFESTAGAGDGDAFDRVISMETRIGTNLGTGAMWPTRLDPQNRSATYAWFCDSTDDIPFSERYQMRGDPRHSPYADTDRHGDTAANGYNWFFDDLNNGTGDFRNDWPALDGGRLKAGWKGRTDHDIGRMMQWLRTAIVKSEAIYTTLAGFSYYYLSVGGDVGYDSANGYPSSIPMDGLPFGLGSNVFENTITGGGGTSSIIGSRKFVRTNAGSNTGIRAGGYWWSKPFLGELFPDDAYATQWRTSGNLVAAVSTGSVGHRLARRSDVATAQMPQGTTLFRSVARLASEGCTSFFNIGSSSSTFHHDFKGGQTGALVSGGLELANNYGYAFPTNAQISRPFGLNRSGAGGIGDEFNYTGDYPRFNARIASTFYNHQSGLQGSALVQQQEPGLNPRGGFIVVSGLDKTIENGTSFIARYSILSLVHSFFEAGVPGTENRIRQLPRIEITYPTIITEIVNPDTITLQWTSDWRRWDGRKYTQAYADDFSESEGDTVYVLLYSRDNGKTWLNMLNDQPESEGKVPWIDGVGPDPARTVNDVTVGSDESWVWNVPEDRFPRGSYAIRIEAHRRSESSHYSMHQEKIYVDR